MVNCWAAISDEIDLVVLNDAPLRVSFNILKDGRLLFFRDKKAIINFDALVKSPQARHPREGGGP